MTQFQRYLQVVLFQHKFTTPVRRGQDTDDFQEADSSQEIEDHSKSTHELEENGKSTEDKTSNKV